MELNQGVTKWYFLEELSHIDKIYYVSTVHDQDKSGTECMLSYNEIITNNQIAIKPLDWKTVCNKTFNALHTMYSLIRDRNHELSNVGMIICS